VKEHCYSVYIVASYSGVLYIGMTSDLQERVWQHKNGVFEGFTKKYKCHRLVFFERFSHVAHAIRREKQLKGWTRVRKIALIESMNPRWQDLSENWGREILFPQQSKAEGDAAIAKRIILKVPGTG
jgi:putative endonuclease